MNDPRLVFRYCLRVVLLSILYDISTQITLPLSTHKVILLFFQRFLVSYSVMWCPGDALFFFSFISSLSCRSNIELFWLLWQVMILGLSNADDLPRFQHLDHTSNLLFQQLERNVHVHMGFRQLLWDTKLDIWQLICKGLHTKNVFVYCLPTVFVMTSYQ